MKTEKRETELATVRRAYAKQIMAPFDATNPRVEAAFAANRDRPFARIDRAGLLWLLNGDNLIALSENTATIERRTGARQIYRRKLSGSGRVLAWELT